MSNTTPGQLDRCRHRVTTATAAVLCAALALSAPGRAPDGDGAPTSATVARLHKQVNQSLGLLQSDLVTLDIDRTPGRAVQVVVPTVDGPVTFDLAPHSVQAADYQVLVQVEGGELVPAAPRPIRTVRGSIIEIPGSAVAGSIDDDGLYAMARLPDGSRLMVEPAARHAGGLAPDRHVVYRDGDIADTGASCGWSEAWQEANGGFEEPAGVPGGGVAGGPVGPECAEIAIDADFEYFTDYGSVEAVEDRVNLVINTMNVQYETQVNITHFITAIVIRTSAGSNPYTSNDAGTLLGQFTSVWDSPPESDVPRDVAELFTGRDLVAPVIGVAWLSSVCDTSGGVQGTSVVESDFNGNFACATDLTAHELGHNWSAGHCSCGTTMNSSITCSNTFGTGTIDVISAFRDSRPCLGDCSPTTSLPFFDDAPSATIDDTLWGLFDGVESNTLGNGEPSPPNSFNLDNAEELRTARMNAAGLSDLTVSYSWQRTGSGGSPENNEDLVVEYEDVNAAWIEINRHPGNGPDGDPFQAEAIVLPDGTGHPTFRVRFRAEGSGDQDDWFVDDVGIDGIVPPPNDACAAAQLVANQAFAFDTTGATTDGLDESGICGATPESDIWFTYVTPCENGTFQIDLSALTFDAVVTVYGDSTCPTGANQAVACFTTPGLTSVTVPVGGPAHRIRIGGLGGAEGSGVLTITCSQQCAEDCAGGGDGNVDVTDLLELLAQWGSGGGCDIAPQPVPDGIVDVTDLLGVLAAWGSPLCN